MLNQFSRTQLLIGKEAMDRLSKTRVAIFGIGGVGGYTAEALARSGVGELDLIDDDKVCLTNINRQIFATRKTVGKYKVDVAEERLKDINPDIIINKHQTFYTPETSEKFDFSKYDYVVDAIDTVTGKIELVMQADKAKTPIICSMGAGNKLDPTAFEVADIYKTSVCPLARVMRHELKKRGIKKLKVVYSKEKPITPVDDMAGLDCVGKTSLYGILSGERIVTNNVDYSDTYCLDNNISFTQETTLSGHRTEKTIQQARKQGYYVIMYYVGLNSKEESLARIENRVRKGGHDIPKNDVCRRFDNRFDSLKRIVPLCDEVIFYDNENGFIKVAEIKNNKFNYSNGYRPKWITEFENKLKLD